MSRHVGLRIAAAGVVFANVAGAHGAPPPAPAVPCVDLRLPAQADATAPARSTQRLAYPRAVPKWMMATGAGLLAGVVLAVALEPAAAGPYLDTRGAQTALLGGLAVGSTALLVGLGLAASNHVVEAGARAALRPTVVIGPTGGALALAGGF